MASVFVRKKKKIFGVLFFDAKLKIKNNQMKL